jgi:dihydropteroate synthase
VLVGFGLPVLIGASRKSFLGRVLADPAGTPRPVDEREAATVALTAYAATQGAWGVRVHDVRANVDAARTIAAVREGSDPMTDRIALTGLRIRATTAYYRANDGPGRTLSWT